MRGGGCAWKLLVTEIDGEHSVVVAIGRERLRQREHDVARVEEGRGSRGRTSVGTTRVQIL